MQVIQAYRKRTGELRQNYTRLQEQEMELFKTRSKSWILQMQGSPDRESELEAVHDKIDGIVLEIERLTDLLSESLPPAARTAGEDMAAAGNAASRAPASS
ncbi:MAG: hypothetical protein O7B79_08820 [SAR324 cluster bacterium]|nr:hypothetical protein [SAR324 cluster bacterium]